MTATTRPAPAPLPALVNGRYRVVTVAYLPFDALPQYPAGPALVTVGGWNTSTSSLSPLSSPTVIAVDNSKVTLNVFRMHGDAVHITSHELDGTQYPTRRDADRAAYNAGVTGFMVYEHDRELLGIGFRVTDHKDADGRWCRVSLCNVFPPEQRASNPDRCPAGCPDSRVEVFFNPADVHG